MEFIRRRFVNYADAERLRSPLKGGTAFTTLSPTIRGFYENSLGKDPPPVVEEPEAGYRALAISFSRRHVSRHWDRPAPRPAIWCDAPKSSKAGETTVTLGYPAALGKGFSAEGRSLAGTTFDTPELSGGAAIFGGR